MPEIRQYTPQVNPQGPVASQPASPEEFGSSVGQAMQGVGEKVGELGQVLYQRKAQEDLSNLDAKMAKSKEKLGLLYQDQLQKGTLNHDDFMKNVSDEMDSIGQDVNTREGRFRFNQLQAATNLDFSIAAQKGQAELAGVEAFQNAKVAMDSRTSYVMGNPASFQQTLKESNQSIDDMVSTGALPALKAPELKRLAMDQMAAGALRGIMKANPEEAQKQLESGMWDSYMGENTKYKMGIETKRAQYAKLLDQERADKLKEKAAAAVQEATSQQFLAAMHDPSGPGLSAKDVLQAMQAGKIDSTTAEHFWKAIETDNQEKKLKSDPYVFNDLTQRIALPDGDPKKITDTGEINKHLGHDISIPDANLLYGLLGDKHTPQGDAEAAIQKTYFESIRTQLVKKNALGLEDPEGLKIYQDVQSQALQYSLQAAQNGKTKMQIWSPVLGTSGKPNPDYVGNNIAVPQRSAQDIMKSTIDLMKRGQQPSDSTLMELPDGSSAYIPNKNVDEAVRRGAKKKAK